MRRGAKSAHRILYNSGKQAKPTLEQVVKRLTPCQTALNLRCGIDGCILELSVSLPGFSFFTQGEIGIAEIELGFCHLWLDFKDSFITGNRFSNAPLLDEEMGKMTPPIQKPRLFGHHLT
jgi:hypothetical protein